MSGRFAIKTLGDLRILHDGETVKDVPSRKAMALFVYLAVERGSAHRRESLFTLLWPGMPESSARHNLRQVLYALRQAFPEVPAPKGEETVSLLLADRQTIQLHPDSIVDIDVQQLDSLLESTKAHDHLNLGGCVTCARALEQAAALYGGDFLSDFYLEDSNEFEDWAEAIREAYRRKVLEILGKLTEIFIRKADYDQAQVYAEQQLTVDPLAEAGYRQLMELLTQAGKRAEALRIYQRCVQTLGSELGTKPSQETTSLYEIISGEEPHRQQTRPRDGFIRGYEIREHLGSGHTGMVYRAYQPVINRDVAIKVIQPQFANHPDFIRRFEVEAQLVARLEHPYIVPLYDYFRDPTGAYLVMRWLKGGSLQSALARGPWMPLSAVQLIEQIAAALALAHNQGVVHCDIKPANILLDEEGNSYLSDFGISILTGPLGQMSQGANYVGDSSSSGSLGYASPEVTRGLDMTPLADVYSLGVVIFELLTGVHPFPNLDGEALVNKHLRDPLPSVLVVRPDLPPAVDEIIQKATDKDPARRFQDSLALAKAFKQAAMPDFVTPLTMPEIALETRNPYKGLRPFEEADAGDFFGREELVERLLEQLSPGDPIPDAGARFLAVVGPSGSGKSSVVKAGLIPSIRRGSLPGSENWFIVEMTPGSHPLEELETALLRIAIETPENLLTQLEADRRGLVRVLQRALPEAESELMLVIDQFEELFTLVEEEAQRDHFLDMLSTAVNDSHSRLRLVITLRADFYDRPLQHGSFGELMRVATEVVLPFSAEELERAICGPAEGVNVQLEPALVTHIVQELGDQPGTLPLLQYALTELFESRTEGQLSLAEYEKTGGILGALGRRAEEIFRRLKPSEQAATRQLFIRLVTLGEGIEDTRRRVLRSELEALCNVTGELAQGLKKGVRASVLYPVIEQYGRYRLLTFDHDPVSRAPTVEVAHEALLREWPRLRGWLDESRADIRLQRLLGTAAREWAESGGEVSFLLHGTRLDQYTEWSAATLIALTEEEKAYLEASLAARHERKAAEAERQAREAALERRSRQILWALVGVFAAAAIIAMILSNSALKQRAIAQENAVTATYAQGQALFEAATAVVAQAEAQRQAEIALTAQAQEASQRVLAEAAEAQAVIERAQAEEQRRIAVARELANAALNTLDVDPERSILLALEAIKSTKTYNGTIMLEAESALHQAIQASRIMLSWSGHDKLIAGVAWSPDGKRIASGTYDGTTAIIWDAETGQELLTLSGHTDVVFEVEFSPDGTQLATSGYDGTTKIWAVESGRLIATLSGHTDKINGVSFNPAGTLLATASFDKTVKLWDVRSGAELFTLIGHTAEVWDTAFSPDGSLLASCGIDGTVRLWNPVSGEAVRVIEAYNDTVSRVAFSPDGRRLATTGSGGFVKIWELETGSEILSLEGHGSMVLWSHFLTNGEQLITAGSDTTVRVWDTFTGEELYILHGHTGPVIGLDLSPDGSRAVTGGFDGKIKIWDISGERELLTLAGHTAPVTSLSYSPDSARMITGGEDGAVILWEVMSRQKLFTLSKGDNTSPITAVEYSQDGKYLAAAWDEDPVILWDAETGEELHQFQGHSLSPFENTYRGLNDIAISPDSTRLVTAGYDKLAKVWDTETGEELFVLQGHEDAPGFPDQGVTKVLFSPDGHFIITAGADGTIRFWEADSGELVYLLDADIGVILGLDIDPDGLRLAAYSYEGNAKIFKFARSADEINVQVELALSDYRNLGFSPDGKSIFAVSGDNAASLWDLEASIAAGALQEVVRIYNIPQHETSDIDFSPDGKYLAAETYDDGTVQVYVVDTAELLALAQDRVTRSLTEEECRQYLHVEACP